MSAVEVHEAAKDFAASTCREVKFTLLTPPIQDAIAIMQKLTLTSDRTTTLLPHL
jgi:hypothetical protein